MKLGYKNAAEAAREQLGREEPGKLPDKIMVYFSNGNKAVMDRTKTVFVRRNNGCFDFTGVDNGKAMSYAEMLAEGCAVVNWDNVSWVRGFEDVAEDPDD